MPNGIDLSEFESLPPRGEFRKKYLIGDDEKVVLYVGRLHKTKGIDLLIKAFAGVSKELNNTKLIIVGPDDGHLRALKELIKELAIEEKVVFTGLLYERDKLQAYVDADIFVTPSFYGFPVTFMEACACGVPIVTTTKGDRLDWMDGQVGLVVPYDKNQLQDAIVKFLSDNGLRRRFGEKGKMLVRERFNWTKIVKQLEHIYSNITHSS
ncbi:MAG: GDP-mannose-dependent alpha-(1-6)-phosphatidylinositol monomannoside mannosyltransferase [Syntrophomonadaceae bacterium]|nr:GDP-mannose-dependent alpha-(1-6)-phosphatidylinositol monomannoside mannosyltransferase [Bacillota bacterium]